MRRFLLGVSFLACLTAVLLSLSRASALNEPTHEIINEEATKRSSLDSVLKERLGIPEGIDKTLRGTTEANKVLRWIRRGGTFEDLGATVPPTTSGPGRFYRHFHDPLLAWDQAGLNIGGVGVPATRFQSSIRWMQRSDQDAETHNGNFSWANARDYFLAALKHPDAMERERRLADLFRALGQVMHLVVDASVPEHVRNDIHPMGYLVNGHYVTTRPVNYEYFVQSLHEPAGTEDRFTATYLTPSIGFDAQLLRTAPNDPIATSPIARLLDGDQYTGGNPAVTANTLIGIGEIANANFFSEDTRGGEYPHPNRGTLVAPAPQPYFRINRQRLYLRKDPPGLTTDPVAYACGATAWVGDPRNQVCVDAQVWRQTATLMLPRAVGYAQGVLDYFFRGELRVDQLFPSTRSVDPRLLEEGNRDIDTVAVWLRNASRWGGQPEGIVPNPEGRAGTLTLVARYQDGPGQGAPEQSATFVLQNPALFTALPHVADTSTPVALLFVLAPGERPVPTGPDRRARNLTYTLIFEGQLGAEKNAIIARVLQGPILRDGSPRLARRGAAVTGQGEGIEAAQPTLRFAQTPVSGPAEEVTRDATLGTIQARVPPFAATRKPGVGGLRLRREIPGQLPTPELIWSNPVPFIPIAEVVLRNTTAVPLRVSVMAAGSIEPNAPEPPPAPVQVDVPPSGAVSLAVPTGFLYVTNPPAQEMPPGGFPVERLALQRPDYTFSF